MRHYFSTLAPGRGPFLSKFPKFGLQNLPNLLFTFSTMIKFLYCDAVYLIVGGWHQTKFFQGIFCRMAHHGQQYATLGWV